MAKNTGQPLEKLADDVERDYFLTADEAKDYGIVDKVLSSRAEVVSGGADDNAE